MVIDRDGHRLLGIFLSYHIFVQTRLDLMRRRNILDVQLMEFLRLLLFFLDLLSMWLHILKIRHVEELHARHVHQPAQVHRTVCHSVKAPLHAVRAYRDMVRQIDHLPGHTFRPVADETDLLISVILSVILLLSLSGHLLFPVSGRIRAALILFCIFFV